MERAAFNITFSRIALQVWIMILIPSSFVLTPLLLLLNFKIPEWLFMTILFLSLILSLICTIKLIGSCTRKGIVEVDEEGLKFIFEDKGVFYQRFNNLKISWAEVSKMAFSYDYNHDVPFLVFRFNHPASYICMQNNESKGMDMSNWPLWLALESYSLKYEHIHNEHRMNRSGFQDSVLFRVILWAVTIVVIFLVLYKLIEPASGIEWYTIIRILVFLLPAHIINLKHRRQRGKHSPEKISDRKAQ